MALSVSGQEERNEKLDRNKFEYLFREFYIQLLRYCTQLIRNQTIAEEIVQEKFVQLWEKRDEINIHTSYKTYLYTSVKNKSIDYLRLKYKKSFITYEEANQLLVHNADPSRLLEYSEFSDIVTKAVEELPEKCFTVFSLKRYGEFTRKEIAEKLNISEKTVDNHLSMATKKIRSYLVKHGFLQ